MGPSAPSTPAFPGAFDVNTWQTWWMFNREPFLRPRHAAQDRNAYTPAAPEAVDRGPSAELIRGTIVPALIEALEVERDDEAVNSILLALARIGDVGDELARSDLADLFASYLDDGNRGVAENACVALGVLGHPSSVPVLSALLGDTERGRELTDRREVPDHLRAYAAYGLGLTGQYAANVDVRRFAAHELLGVLDEDAAKPDVRVAAVIALGMVPPGAGAEAEASNGNLVKRLLVLFDDRRDDDMVRAHAATSMAWLLEEASDGVRKEVAGRLIAALDERNRQPNAVRQSSAMALGRIGDADDDALDGKIRETLVKASRDNNVATRHFALLSLARVAGREGDGKGEPLAGTDDVKKFLFKSLAKGKSTTRPWAALAIGVLGHETPLAADDLTALRSALRETKAAEDAGALKLGAGLCGDVAAADALIADLKEGSRDQRAVTSLALGLMGAQSAVEPLHAVLRDSKHDQRAMKETATALALLGDADLVPTLLEIGEECECTLSQTVLATAMGQTGDARVVDPLIGMLADGAGPARKRAWAAHALGRVADKEALHWTSRISVDVNYGANPPSLTTGDGSGIIDFP